MGKGGSPSSPSETLWSEVLLTSEENPLNTSHGYSFFTSNCPLCDFRRVGVYERPNLLF